MHEQARLHQHAPVLWVLFVADLEPVLKLVEAFQQGRLALQRALDLFLLLVDYLPSPKHLFDYCHGQKLPAASPLSGSLHM